MAQDINGWHAENIKAELRKRFGTVRRFAEQYNISPQVVSDALRTPHASSRVEQLIAEAIGVGAHQLWPDRWTPENLKIDRAQFRTPSFAGRCPDQKNNVEHDNMSGVLAAEIDIDLIDAGDRQRRVDQASVNVLAASMKIVGQMMPIEIRPTRSGRFDLTAGAHRLAAAQQLGWKKIRAEIVECSDYDAMMREVTENLFRADLSPYDFSEFAVLYFRLEQIKDDKRAAIPTVLEFSQRHENAKFYKEAAERTGLNEETIRVAIRRRRQLDDVWDRLRDTDAAKSGVLLDRLRKIKIRSDRDKVLDLVMNNGCSFEEALSKAKGAPDIKPTSAKALFKALTKSWKACPKAKRAEFVQIFADEIIDHLKSGGAI